MTQNVLQQRTAALSVPPAQGGKREDDACQKHHVHLGEGVQMIRDRMCRRATLFNLLVMQDSFQQACEAPAARSLE